MSEEVCPIEGDNFIEHESHRAGAAPKAKIAKRIRGRVSLSPCAVPGISLTNYSKNAQAKGWGAPCTGAKATVTLSNGVRFTVRTEIAELARLIMEEVLRRGYGIRKTDTGAYNCRYISGTTVWSNHAWALAIDINWQSNPMVSPLRTDMPSWMPALFNRYGFAWGGDYSGTKDAMHYEFMGTPAQAAVATELAKRELGLNFPIIGSIRVAFDRFGGISRLGQPLGPEVPTTDPAGRWQNFEYGRIYWHPNVDKGTAHVLFGDIEQRFKEAGFEMKMGWPLTDEMTTPDGKGRYSHFTGNRSIYWYPGIGAKIIKDGIRDAWAAQGWERGKLGYPVDEEHPAEDGIVQNFQGGSIFWGEKLVAEIRLTK